MSSKTVSLGNKSGALPTVQQPKASFPGLPRELRDAIYQQLWKQTPRIYLQSLCQDSLHYTLDTPGTQRGLSCWLLTSKSVFREGLQQLYRRAAWVCRGKCNLRITAMVAFSAFEVVTHFTLIANAYLKTFRQRTQSKYIVTPAEDLGAILSRFGPQLRNFGLRFNHFITQKDKDVPDQGWILDLSSLDSVGTHLHTFSVHCEAHQLGSATTETLAPGLPAAYEAETRRVGALLVGKDSALEVRKNIAGSAFDGKVRRETRLIVIVKCHKKTA